MSVHHEFSLVHQNIVGGRSATVREYAEDPFDDSVVMVRPDEDSELEQMTAWEFLDHIRLLPRNTMGIWDDDGELREYQLEITDGIERI